MYQARQLSIVGMIVVLATGSSLLGQGPQTKLIKVFAVERADPHSILGVLSNLGLGVNLALDESSGAIVARGAEETLATIENLIRELDTPPSAKPDHTTLHLPVRYRNASDVAELVAEANLGRHIRVVPDPGSNLVVVQGRTADLDSIRELVSRIDTPQASFNVSFFFIGANTMTEDETNVAMNLPAALMPVGESLVRIGLGNIALLAPLTTRTQEGSEFSVSGYERYSAGKGLQFTVEGDIQEIAESNTVRSRIRAAVEREDPETGGRTIFSIQTTLVSPLGDYVVLATAPSSNAEYDVLALVVRVDGVE